MPGAAAPYDIVLAITLPVAMGQVATAEIVAVFYHPPLAQEWLVSPLPPFPVMLLQDITKSIMFQNSTSLHKILFWSVSATFRTFQRMCMLVQLNL